MTLPAYPLINGQRHDFSSIELRVRDRVYVGFSSINYSHKLEVARAYGAHPMALGETVGQYSAEGDIEFLLDEFNDLVGFLGDGWGVEKMTIVVTYSQGAQTYTDTLLGARFTSAEASQSAGSDPLKRKMTLFVTEVLNNGKRMLPTTLAQAAQRGA